MDLLKNTAKKIANVSRKVVFAVRECLSVIATFLISNIRDLFFFGGLSLTFYGVWELYTYYACIICGGLLMLFALGWLSRIPRDINPRINK